MAHYSGGGSMMDVSEAQDIENAEADDENCTYAQGYIKGQAVYACMTCCSDAKVDSTKRAGLCFACSFHCHRHHELFEMYTTKKFRCDCGNPKFNSYPCHFNGNTDDLNEKNHYNQNYSGFYCICRRPYPDPELTAEDKIIQCVICEDWLHAKHLNADVPEEYSEMICKECMAKNEFLHDYSGLAITFGNNDIETMEVAHMSNNEHSNNVETSEEINPSAANQDMKTASEFDMHLIVKTEAEINNADNLYFESHVEENMANAEIETRRLISETTKEKESQDKQPSHINDIISVICRDFSDDESDDEEKTQNLPKECINLDKAGTNATETQHEKTGEATNPNPIADIGNEKVTNTEENAGLQIVCNSTTVTFTTDISDNFNSNISEKSTALQDIHYSKDETDMDLQKNETVSVAVNNEPYDTELENCVSGNQPKNIDSTESTTDLDDTIESETPKTEDVLQIGQETSVDKINIEENSSEKTDDTNAEKVPDDIESLTNYNENKRKSSSQMDKDETPKKKVKVETESCVRPKGMIKYLNGATFWPSYFRQKLCTCNECLCMYQELNVSFLVDSEGTVTCQTEADRSIGSTSPSIIQALQTLSLERNLPAGPLDGYNKMRRDLIDFLRSFKAKKQVITEEDINAFFVGVKATKETDGVYFCKQ